MGDVEVIMTNPGQSPDFVVDEVDDASMTLSADPGSWFHLTSRHHHHYALISLFHESLPKHSFAEHHRDRSLLHNLAVRDLFFFFLFHE